MQRLRITSVTIALLLLTAATLAGAKQTAPRPLELQDYYRIESADSAVISPDGRSVAFVRSYLIEAGNVTTPTLFVHGEADIRVPIEQAEQMYMALKKCRIPALFIRYPDSYHGGWTAWNTVHRYYQEMKWWEQYLQRKQSAAR